MIELEEDTVTRRSVQWAKVSLWSVMVLILAGIIGLFVVIFTSPPPARWHSAVVLTPKVKPTGEAAQLRGPGNIAMKATIISNVDPACRSSTKYFIEFSDRTTAEVPGMRLATAGEIKTAVYEAAVPWGSPRGRATFWIRDSYNCGLRARIAESPHAEFEVIE